MSNFNTIQEAVEDIKNGKMIIVKAAELGDVRAQMEMGRRYSEGLGVPKKAD